MYILIVGGGKVGYYLARSLVNEGHEILLIEKDSKKCDRIAEELGSVVMRGDGCEARTLADAGTERADIVVAVTGDDEDNLVICQVAKKKFGVPRSIARINTPKNEEVFRRRGIDVTVSSTNVILAHLEHELPTRNLIHLMSFRNRTGLEIVELRVPASSPVIGRRLKDIELPPDSVVTLIVNEGDGALVPTPDTILRVNDEIVAVTQPERELALRRALAGV